VKNLVNQGAVFCVKNAIKLTSDHLRLEKIFRGLYPRIPERRGEGGGEGREKKGRIGEGKGRERRGEGGEGRKRRRGGAIAPPKMFVLAPDDSCG
jgi:hypothetical protein